MAIVDSLAGPGATRRVLIRGAQAAGVTVASVLAFSLATRALSGGADWGPYLEYLRLYSTQGFAQLRIDFFSPGPLMGAELFLGTVALLWLARDRPQAIARPARVALAGYTGFAVAAFTYYIGRSHANNLWVLLVPAVAIGGLWIHVLLSAPAQTWRTVAAAMLLLVGGMIAADSLPSLRGRWQQTAIGKILPLAGGDSIGQALTRIWHEPVLDPRALGGETLLRRHAPGQGRTLVLTEPDLTVEILLRSDRANLLPMAHPTEDDLLMSNHERVRAAAERIPAGTLMLTSPPPTSGRTPVGGPRTFTLLQRHALEILHRRFDWETIDRAPSGLMMVRLRPRR
jgi:hypothetical protein